MKKLYDHDDVGRELLPAIRHLCTADEDRGKPCSCRTVTVKLVMKVLA
ncbi:MAG: hypothetical protein QXI32_02685 [Candidatus Bathyarchaeia archaeon]